MKQLDLLIWKISSPIHLFKMQFDLSITPVITTVTTSQNKPDSLNFGGRICYQAPLSLVVKISPLVLSLS